MIIGSSICHLAFYGLAYPLLLIRIIIKQNLGGSLYVDLICCLFAGFYRFDRVFGGWHFGLRPLDFCFFYDVLKSAFLLTSRLFINNNQFL
jgi:hypothetical protein